MQPGAIESKNSIKHKASLMILKSVVKILSNRLYNLLSCNDVWNGWRIKLLDILGIENSQVITILWYITYYIIKDRAASYINRELHRDG